jgi:hypothetical protein
MHKGQWDLGSRCREEEIQKFLASAPIDLPGEYLAHLRESDGGGGDIPVQPWLVYFWKVNEILANNEGYKVALNVPGFFAFGTSGGGEMFAFDARQTRPWPIVIIPFIPMDANEAICLAPDFASFQKIFGYSVDDPVDEIRLNGWGHPIDPNS